MRIDFTSGLLPCGRQAQMKQVLEHTICLIPDDYLSFAPECFSNRTMAALEVKVEYAPSLNPSQLNLSDPACGPTYSDDRFAYFHFTVNSCGTTRKVQ